ncbi:unnamed protein product [Psylliodes chrysocephalus]|uniref:Centromere/kinetochore protein zw10 n=1 Tax=Psylliodes chrysocephalus TaxID=3402493 RepID=A0A9P0GH42_9CUCU|nr:unnamed protein product [Psylliodes chrysocephala]
MNFPVEVLPSVDTIDINEINQKVPELKLTIDNLKSEILQYTDNVYIKYSSMSRPKKNRELLNTAQNIEEEIKHLIQNAENVTKTDLCKAKEKLTEHTKKLDTIDFTLKILSNICKINEKLNEFTTCLQANQFYKCRKILSCLEYIISEIPDDEKLLIIDQHQFTIYERYKLLLNKIRHCFQEKVVTKSEDNSASIRIYSDIYPLDQALLAMFYNESSVFTLSEFAGFLWKNFFVPIVDSVVEVKVDANDTFSTLYLSNINLNKKSTYKEVFSQLILVLEFLKNNFNFPLTDLEATLTTVEYIGLDIQDNLSELIIKHCLVDTIPSTVEGLQNYKVVIQDTNKLELVLRETKIFSAETASLLEYANNIDFHFINKKCQDYTLHSQQIMKKDLHDVLEVGEPYDPENSMVAELEQFSQYSISKSVIELLDYCEKILQQAVNGSDMSAGRLLVTCQNILRSYTTFVPEYHNKLLKTIPQQVALFHNNCLYISHYLSKWNAKYVLKMPSTLDLPSKGFDREISILKSVGSDIFGSYVKSQIKQIHEIMKYSGLDGVMLEGDLKPVTEKCIRQCLRQQELLKTVWHKILPYRIYNETIGIILNTLCTCLITPIINFEDISSKSAEQLVDIIKMIISRGPKLFTDPKEVSLYVKFWYKLNELNFVLGASLVDINDRWADGKGPLALQFKPVELKSLIRALFQNTDRRAAILVKIQE